MSLAEVLSTVADVAMILFGLLVLREGRRRDKADRKAEGR